MSLKFETGIDYARNADSADPLKNFKEWFYFPQHKGGNAIYFCGNSLGLQPIHVEKAIQTELDTWREKAVGGYFGGTNPWLFYQDYVGSSLASLVGASPEEVTVMNGLTVNLHLMLLSFYRPTESRYKIIMEAGAFPSDQYAIETMARHFGRKPEDVIVEVTPRTGEKTLHTEDILNTIDQHRNELALVLFGGINYYTGQFFDLAAITQKAHEAGAFAGFDLAHVIGNIPLRLNCWNVDFAVWCSYKYLNAGPGAVGGVFVHAKHAENPETPRLGGWWGNEEKERFKMEKGFIPKANASGWNLSTAQVFNTVALKASLELFDQAGITAIREKSVALTAYLEFLLKQLTNISFEIITPEDPEQRGAQLSLFFTSQGKAIHNKMMDSGIIVDYREPGVIRVAPAPLYCSFEDVYRFYELLKNNF
ncbi:MAG: kynureninase [Sediminibacterium sp.]|nr:kynureninase [Sediminibacterium sp.]